MAAPAAACRRASSSAHPRTDQTRRRRRTSLGLAAPSCRFLLPPHQRSLLPPLPRRPPPRLPPSSPAPTAAIAAPSFLSSSATAVRGGCACCNRGRRWQQTVGVAAPAASAHIEQTMAAACANPAGLPWPRASPASPPPHLAPPGTAPRPEPQYGRRAEGLGERRARGEEREKKERCKK
ncbi:hypothetical protein PVAP13_3NG202963 [Panicum virgatum]|uniref:Uncharacterized protein n=1 Tax=Panicum virgatum TaxID=38727 RepID=A0A8T0UK75_PANVG|nr:hypothetical protein PVAP13_3NG202963 [Panicum virgatum]